jgi:chemotaxis protein methyltransferase WspC
MNDYQEILLLLENETGLNVDSIGLLSIARGINNSMKKCAIENTHIYTEKIKSDRQLFAELIEEIKVPETWFFRDAECFNFVKNHIIENKSVYNSSNPLRILSAPCSTGEEPYSAVMLAFDCGLKHDSIHVVATDISSESIRHAQNKVYRKSSFRNDYDNFQIKYFTSHNTNHIISQDVAKVPVFVEDNLVKNNFLENHSKFDFIFCKNLLIYLSEQARTRVLENIKRLLKEDGALLVGLSEINYFTHNGFEQIKHNMAFACKLSSQPHSYYTDFKPIVPIEKAPEINSEKIISPKPKTKMKTFEPQAVKSTNPTITIESVKSMADKGDFKSAENICNILLQNEYTDSEALYYMGLIQNALHNGQKAADYFKKVLYLQPDHYESLVHISLIYESDGDSQRANLYRQRAERVYLRNNANAGDAE